MISWAFRHRYFVQVQGAKTMSSRSFGTMRLL